MLKLFGVALAGATATTALSACAAPQPKYAIARPALTVEMASPPAADPAASFAQIKVEAPAPAEGDAEIQAAIAAPLGSVDSAALPAIAVAAVQAAPPAAEPQASEPSAVGLTHVVGPGETFFAVGRRYGVTPQAVAETNGLTFSSTLRVGQRLTLPAGARDRGAQAAFPNRTLASAPEPARRPARLAEAPAPLPSAPRPLAAPVQASSTPATDPESVAAAPSLSPAPTPLLSSAVAAAAAAPQPVVPAPMSVAAVQTAPVPTAPVQAESPPANPVSTAPQPSAPTPLPARTPNRYTASSAPITTAPAAVSLPAPSRAATAVPSALPPVAAAPAVSVSAAVANAPTPSPAAAQGRFIWPVRGQVLTGFGPRGPGQRNDGLNIAVVEGEPVRAAATGEVVYAGDQVPGFGKLILLKHPDGWVTAYAHLSEITVKMRQQVRQGAEIGKAGGTGAVPSPQLHFEVRHAASPQERARPVDPLPLLPQ